MSKTTVLSGSHIPVLLEVLKRVHRPVLELGVGYNSTPLLHWYCKTNGIKLLSLETDEKWLNKFKDFETKSHRLELIEDWDSADIDQIQWGMVLIDHRPAMRRRVEAKRLKDNAEYILMHDSEPEINRFYGYTKIYPLFKYRFDFTKVKPNTTILSNYRELSWLKNLGNHNQIAMW